MLESVRRYAVRRSVPCAPLSLAVPADRSARTACRRASRNFPSGLAGATLRIVVGFAAAGGAAEHLVARLYAKEVVEAGFGSAIIENRQAHRHGWPRDQVQEVPPGWPDPVACPLSAVDAAAADLPQPGLRPRPRLVPVALVVDIPTAVVCGVAQPYANLRQYVDWARQNPRKATLGLATIGSSGHLALRWVVHRLRGSRPCSYRAPHAMLVDVASGEVSIGWDATASMMPMYRSGKIRFLGLSGERRLSALPEVPTAREQGFNEFVPASSWYGIYAPAGTPAEVIAALERTFMAAASNPRTQPALDNAGLHRACRGSLGDRTRGRCAAQGRLGADDRPGPPVSRSRSEPMAKISTSPASATRRSCTPTRRPSRV
jgi:hypothetical protein